MFFIKSSSGYTLVELIVVITILVILSTVGFVGYAQYTSSSRDGARVSDLRAIYQGLWVSLSQKGVAPSPDSPVSVFSSTGVLLSLQGSVGDTTRWAIGMESGGRDPQSGLGYTYLRFKDKKSVQLMAMMESEGWGTKLAMRDDLSPLSGTAYAAEDYSDKHPGTFGKKIGVFADCTNNSPLQEIATYTGSGMNASIAATGTGICVYGNTSSGSRELLSSTWVLARVITPASTVVAGNTPTVKNCDVISNSDGANWDVSECIDARVYTHPAAVITANGGNAAFFDRKYSIIKMGGKWMMNENLKYPLDISRYHDPSTGANSSDRYTCASSIGNGYSGNGTPECNLTNDLGYLYTGPTAQLACPTWWSLPTSVYVNTLNDTAGQSSYVLQGKILFPSFYSVSTYNWQGYFADTFTNVKAGFFLGWDGGPDYFVINDTNTNSTDYGLQKSFRYGWFGYSAYAYPARCVKN